MYRRILFALLLLSFIAFPVSSENIEIKKSLNGFDKIKEIYIEGNLIYVNELENERIKVYNFDLEEIRRINVERRYLRDFVVDGRDIYGVQYLGLFKLYSKREKILEDIAGVVAFEKEKGKDYYYLVKYGGEVDKYEGDKLIKSTNKGEGKLDNLKDIAINEFIYVASENKIYKFDKNLSYIKERVITKKINGISYYKGYLLVSYDEGVYVLNDDLVLIKEYTGNFNITKAYVGDNRLILFNSTSLIISNNLFEEEKEEAIDLEIEKNESISNESKKEEIVYEKSLKERDYSYVYNLVLLVLLISIFILLVVVIIVKKKMGRRASKRYKGYRKKR